jgi:hypothetical protein
MPVTDEVKERVAITYALKTLIAGTVNYKSCSSHISDFILGFSEWKAICHFECKSVIQSYECGWREGGWKQEDH